MGTVVDATVRTSQFALSDTFEAVPEAEVEVIRVVAQGRGYVMPFLWVSAPDLDEIHEVLKEDATTENVQRLVEQRGKRSLYRMKWQANVRLMVYVLGMEDGMLLDAEGKDGEWKLRILFPDHDSVSSTYEFCQEYGINLSIRRVKGISESIDRGGIGLTEEQYEALVAGFEADYYDVPRGRTQEELAEELGVSHQALSERLRRGQRALIEQALE